MSVFCFDHKEQSCAALADRIVQLCKRTLTKKEHFSLVLSGGSTPRQLYSLLASDRYIQQIDWRRVHIFFGDERCVPPDSVDSNFNMAHSAMLQKLSIPEDHIHRIRAEKDPHEEALHYQQLIMHTLASISADVRFDCLLLGLGDDGHTASLFPGDAALKSKAIVTAVAAPKKMVPSVERISLTFEGIHMAQQICFLVHGEIKTNVVRHIIQTKDKRYPAAMIRPELVSWFLSGMDCSTFIE